MARGGEQMWCILRTSARSTLRLAEAIRKEGIEAWTPSEVSKPRIPKRRARITLQEPILPRFVFADASRLADVLALSHRPFSGFTVMKLGAGHAVARESSLKWLREEEAERERKRLIAIDKEKREARRKSGSPLDIGSLVEMPKGGSWEGLSGVVERSDNRRTVIDLGRYSVEVETWQLANDVLSAEAMAA